MQAEAIGRRERSMRVVLTDDDVLFLRRAARAGLKRQDALRLMVQQGRASVERAVLVLEAGREARTA